MFDCLFELEGLKRRTCNELDSDLQIELDSDLQV